MNEATTPAKMRAALPAVARLVLANFRSYAALDLALAPGVLVLTGENGAGKTNLIEAISLLCPGRGLRRADLAECARAGGPGTFAISAEVTTHDGTIQLGTGTEIQAEGSPIRRYRLNREPLASIRPFADYLRIVWLTPAMDGLFSGPAGERRRFLDRLVLAIDSEHGGRVNALERALRNRNRLLENGGRDRQWLDATEREVAEIGVAVAAARQQTVAHLAQVILQDRDAASPFPFAELTLKGDVEDLLATRPALEAEDIYRDLLRQNRGRDAAAGRTLIGPHTADLLVVHGPKQAEAARSSTGEQKALLIGLVLAHARLVAALSGIRPFVLLDEIAAHLDAARRAALYERLLALESQVFMTGADRAAFAGLEERAQFLHVTPGRVE
ncbi:DNA replication and repair protein RecF [Methylovirgula ligni]|uniref:DNA replication and repair protein RecF n=1 Tax=Methylovirgula ligni TaxID=569860 RepID=A0A3D9Z826_9HYPH|nr:DNA replication/repair protein RecF [Methylovirgula ligni]REF87436.1 DNA replication and repair protein RecF [Methylovirgula ligni]